jgi:sugar lactone lactonase YvrE
LAPGLPGLIVLAGLACVLFTSCGKPARKQPADLKKTATLAGKNREFGEPFGIAVKDGVTYISDGQNGKILTVSQSGTISTFAEGLDTPSGIAFDKNGVLFVADTGSDSIKKLDAAGKLITVAGSDGQAGYVDGEVTQARFNAPIGIAVAEDATIYVADTYNDRIRKIHDGKVSTLAGSRRGFVDGPGSLANFDTPCGLALMPDGDLAVADFGNRRLRLVTANGETETIAGSGRGEFRDGLLGSADLVAPTALAVDPSGSIFVADGNAIRVIRASVFPFVETIAGNRRGLKDGSSRSAEFNRPSGIALDTAGNLFIADSDNQLVRTLSDHEIGAAITPGEIEKPRVPAEEFRAAAPPRWPYDPPNAKREIAGTLGEIRGEIGPNNEPVWFHNGLDVVGSYGETARFVRDEKVLLPLAVQNVGTLRELIRMPTMGYIHVRIGRDQYQTPFRDGRFQFDGGLKLTDVRVPRGARFRAGEPIGTLNPMNHVHLIAGRSGVEMNSLDALILPGISDGISPTIEKVSLFDTNWHEIETASTNSRIKLAGKIRVVIRAFDRMDGNANRRRLGVYSVGYAVYRRDGAVVSDHRSAINFKRLPDDQAVPFVYGPGSRSGATGETIFNYIATNEVDADSFREDFLDVTNFDPGQYLLKVFASDYLGNTITKDINFEVTK